MRLNRAVTVFGAYGHTGRFVVAELHKRGLTAILSGRDSAKLRAMRDLYPKFELRAADLANPHSIESTISGSSVIINCAGPFLDTAIPIIEAAIRSRIHYLDIAAEQAAVLQVFERCERDAHTAGVVIVPAMGFYGGLGDLMATAAMGEWASADEICIAVVLDSWKPTRGTRLTGERNHGRRFIFSNNKLERADPPPGRVWKFPAPFGEQEVLPLSLSETIIIPRHLRTPDVRMFINAAPLAELRDPNTPSPTPADDSGRSAQTFLIDVIVRRGSEERRIVARGRDIYAITAPIVVEAAERIINGLVETTGVVAAGHVFKARHFLDSLSPAHLTLTFL